MESSQLKRWKSRSRHAQTIRYPPTRSHTCLSKDRLKIKRQSGHIVMSNGNIRLTIPRHNPINAITMGNIAKDAGLSPEQFKELL